MWGCFSDKSTSLHECFPEPPVALPQFGVSSCGVGRNNESNNAVAVCASIHLQTLEKSVILDKQISDF